MHRNEIRKNYLFYTTDGNIPNIYYIIPISVSTLTLLAVACVVIGFGEKKNRY